MSSRRAGLLMLAASLMSLLYGLYLMYVVLAPLYSLKGVFTGEIAISWYKLEMEGEKIHLSTLDTVRILGFPVYTLGFFSIITGLVGVYIILRRPNLKQVIVEMILASALAGIIYSALIVQLGRLASREAMHLDIDLVYRNNAGLVNFGVTEVNKLAAANLVSPGPVLAFTTVYLLFALVSVLVESQEKGEL